MIITKQLSQAHESVKSERLKASKAVEPERLSRIPRIGLALSGGGFRAAIFHLGVIRRLEEMGIMPRVRVISAVSGGSIISAYYLCEMERRLRHAPPGEQDTKEVRLALFEEIAGDFFEALDNNLRSRALVFSPFYHPWLFIKTLFLKAFRTGARSELIQREYDLWFYKKNTVDQLPSAAGHMEQPGTKEISGTRLLINTTSLLSGERKTFSREPISHVNEMSRVNKNSLRLSRVVGASSGVPGLFPPTMISGDVLVDGGVADNQGIEALIEDPRDCNVLLVSDASGQMEPVHTIGMGLVKVLSRVNSIFQFQVRNKLLDILVGWKHLPEQKDETHEFAFIHLHLNLKDRGKGLDRIRSEFIPGVAGIRTDLDQFSFIEREALMYHGYTLMDSQIRHYCKDSLSEFIHDPTAMPMAVPPLFQERSLDSPEGRKKIRADLEAGSQNLYLLRSLKKYPAKAAPLLGAATAVILAFLYSLRVSRPGYIDRLGQWISAGIMDLMPNMVIELFRSLVNSLGLVEFESLVRGIFSLASLAIISLLFMYVIIFLCFIVLRRKVSQWDRKAYKDLTGVEPTVKWSGNNQEVPDRPQTNEMR